MESLTFVACLVGVRLEVAMLGSREAFSFIRTLMVVVAPVDTFPMLD